MSEVTVAEKVDRSFVGMRNALFDMWDNIRNKTLDVREAEVAAKISAGICKTVEIELKVRKMQVSSASNAPPPQSPPGFLLGTSK